MDHRPATRPSADIPRRPRRSPTKRLPRIGHHGEPRGACSRQLAAAGRAGRPGGPFAPAGPGRHGVPGRGRVPVGRPPGMGALAARHPVPPFPAYFSGAPVIYPPLAALADSVGGLAGARLLSLVFMLGATALLWATASPAVRAPGRVLRGRAVRRPRPDAATGRVRHLRRHVAVPARAGRLVRGPGRATGRTRPAG